MARPEKMRLEVKQAAEAGRAENVFRFSNKYVQVHGTFVATVQVEGSIDGSDYFAVGGPQSAPGYGGVRYGLGAGIRLSIVTFDVTLGYSWNPNPRPWGCSP
jgi:hypothetical protein